LKKIKSKYQFWSLLLVVSVLSVDSIFILKLLMFGDALKESLSLLVILIVFLVILLGYLTWEFKRIIIDHSGIELINPLFPFLRKKYRWSHLNYFVDVNEYSQYDSYESVWIIVNHKVKLRISGFTYSNVKDLRREIRVACKGSYTVSYFQQVFYMFGILKIKTENISK
jgi:hypothetical protein